jgi:hypothetical protein
MIWMLDVECWRSQGDYYIYPHSSGQALRQGDFHFTYTTLKTPPNALLAFALFHIALHLHQMAKNSRNVIDELNSAREQDVKETSNLLAPDNCRSNISLIYPQSEGVLTFQAGNQYTRWMGRSFPLYPYT